jgi:hypothetical protein
MLLSAAVPVRICAVSFGDARGIRHSVEVEAESLYEAAVLAVARFRKDPWIEPVGDATPLQIEVREPATTHSISLAHVERWIGSSSSTPLDATKKAKLKTLLVQSSHPAATRSRHS